MRLAVTLFILLATPLWAQDLPALYAVTGVADDDVLNVRRNPRATGDKFAGLAPDATGIEVVALSDSGEWGQVNAGEGAGWVRMRYLAAQPGLSQGETYFDRPLSCFGTEPFWGLATGDGTAVLTTPGGEDSFKIAASLGAAGRGAWSQAAELDGAGGPSADSPRATAVVRRGACGDGMSDRAYGLSAEVLLRDFDGTRTLLSGCCSIALR